jgi:hypothetical protein
VRPRNQSLCAAPDQTPDDLLPTLTAFGAATDSNKLPNAPVFEFSLDSDSLRAVSDPVVCAAASAAYHRNCQLQLPNAPVQVVEAGYYFVVVDPALRRDSSFARNLLYHVFDNRWTLRMCFQPRYLQLRRGRV